MEEKDPKEVLRDNIRGEMSEHNPPISGDDDSTEVSADDFSIEDSFVMPTKADSLDIPELSLEDFEIPEEEEEPDIVDETKGSIKFGILGSGQGGGRVAKSFFDIGYKKTIALNTASHDLELLALPPNRKMILDIGEAGAGKDMSRGSDAVLRFKQEIFEKMRSIFGTDITHILVCVGGGGGSGSGSFIPLLEIARQYMAFLGKENPGNHIGGMITLPTRGELNSPRVSANAFEVLNTANKLASSGRLNPLILIDNNKIQKMYKGLTVKQFWPAINNTVSGLFDIFNRLSNFSSPYSSVDPTDYRSVLEAGGIFAMGVTKVKNFHDETEVSKAIKNNIEKSLLADVDLSTATMSASIAVGGKDIMENTVGLMDNLNYGFDMLSSLCPNATIHRGIYEDDKDTLRVYTIVGGMSLSPKIVRNLNKDEIYP